jgi:hypothetical protein
MSHTMCEAMTPPAFGHLPGEAGEEQKKGGKRDQ